MAHERRDAVSPFTDRGALVAPALATALAAAALALWVHSVRGTDPWAHWTLGTDGLRAVYCEQNRLGAAVRQPVNSWSNLAYVFAAGLMAGAAQRDRKRRSADAAGPLQRAPAFSLLFGAGAAVLGAGSFGWHASLAWPFQRLDMASTYALVLANIAYLGYRVAVVAAKAPPRAAAITALVAWAVAGVAMFVTQFGLREWWVLPTMLGLAVALGVFYQFRLRARARTGYVLAAGACVATGIGVWWLDVFKVACAPRGLFQFHALWHVLTAAGALLAYLYFYSERDSVTKGTPSR